MPDIPPELVERWAVAFCAAINRFDMDVADNCVDHEDRADALRLLEVITPEDALALAVALGGLREERGRDWLTDKEYVPMRRWVSKWEEER